MKTKSEFLSTEIVQLLNYRVEQEEFSSRTYLSMSLWSIDKGYLGAGKLFKKYSEEELEHAGKARAMLLANGVQPITSALKQPEQEFENLPKAIQIAFAHETEITKQCYALTKAAYKEENYMVAELGLWYCKEQAEELDKFQNLLDRCNAFGEKSDMLRELDEEMEKLSE
ncbi:ferritin [Maribacter sp. CXY002]|uniref:ferritin n=1 Tax=Maribacter luteocoastalis TaxID=3407671 RepID=UPI003B66BA2E